MLIGSPDLLQGAAVLVDQANLQAIPRIVLLHDQGLKKGPDIQDQSHALGLNQDLGQEEVLDVITQDLVLVQGLTEGLEAARIVETTEDVTATVVLPCQTEGGI